MARDRIIKLIQSIIDSNGYMDQTPSVDDCAYVATRIQTFEAIEVPSGTASGHKMFLNHVLELIKSGSSNDAYMSGFLMMLTHHLLSSSTQYINCITLIQKRVLHLILASMTGEDVMNRTIGYSCLQAMHRQLEEGLEQFKDGLFWMGFINNIKINVTQENQRLSSFEYSFYSLVIDVLLKPPQQIFESVKKMICEVPVSSKKMVAFLGQMLTSSDPNNYSGFANWSLKTIINGLKSTEDFEILYNGKIFDLLTMIIVSNLTSVKQKILIMSILESVSSLESSSKSHPIQRLLKAKHLMSVLLNEVLDVEMILKKTQSKSSDLNLYQSKLHLVLTNISNLEDDGQRKIVSSFALETLQTVVMTEPEVVTSDEKKKKKSEKRKHSSNEDSQDQTEHVDRKKKNKKCLSDAVNDYAETDVVQRLEEVKSDTDSCLSKSKKRKKKKVKKEEMTE